MICYYNKNETVFSHNGLGVLDAHIIGPVVTEMLNGIFKLEFDYPTHAPHGDGLTPERIVRCPVPNMQDQLFRINEREAAIGGVFHVVAFHVFYDLAQNLIEDTFIVSKYGAAALEQLLGATQFPHGFTSDCNIDVVNNARLVRRNAAAAILDGSAGNSFLSRWGGEIVRDRFHIFMRAVRGSNNGVCIRDKKNLTGYRADIDYGPVATRIMPMGFDGLLLPEKYVDSPRIGDYLTPRIRVVKYEKVKAAMGEYADDEDAVPLPEAQEMLRQLAAQEYSVNKADLPACSYSIEFAPLERTEEYKNFAILESVNIGDIVRVVHEEDGLDISARMIGYQYDPLVRAYISVDLGTAAPKFTSTLGEITSAAISAVQSALASGGFSLPQAGSGRASTHYGSQEPSNPFIGDLWYKQNGDKLELWIYETRDGVTQWWPLLTDLTMEEMKQELAAAAAEVEAAREAAQDALEAGQKAKDAADQAATDAQAAVAKANQAFDNAVAALNDAGNASTTAASAFNKSVKSTAVSYAVSTSGVTAPTSGWQATVPTTAAGQFLWTRTIITLQDNSTVTSYSVAKHGETGPAGAQGSTGPAGPAGSAGTSAPTITMVREQYYLSTSSTAQSGGSWSDTVPAWVNGRHYWTRVAATYSNSTTTYSAPVLAAGLNNSLVTALEAKTSAETLSTTVSQHATSISLNATNITNISGRVTTAESAINLLPTTIRLGVESHLAPEPLVRGWERNRWNTTTGAHLAATGYVRGTHDIPVAPGDQFIGQTMAGASFAFNFIWYNASGGFISYINSTAAQTAPAGAATLRVAAIWAAANRVEDFACTVVRGNTRIDMTKRPVSASTILMQNNFINLRVAKDEVINQINISTEGILIAGNRIHITGTTTIDNAVIRTAMIADAQITDAKISNLSAAKITTGTLSADRIAAGSITSAKLTIANGFITNAMIQDATIQSAKIATIDAAKITTGTLNANLIKAGVLTDMQGRFSVNMTTGAASLSGATITGGSISIGGSTFRTVIDAGELSQYALGNGVFICGLTPFSAGTEYRPTLYIGSDSRVTGFSISRLQSGNIVNIAQFDKTKIDLINPVNMTGTLSVSGALTANGIITSGSNSHLTLRGLTYVSLQTGTTERGYFHSGGLIVHGRIECANLTVTNPPWPTSVALPASPNFTGTVYGNRFSAAQDGQAYQVNGYSILDYGSNNIRYSARMNHGLRTTYAASIYSADFLSFFIGNTERAYVSTGGVVNTSLAESKTDIHEAGDALDIVQSATLYRYRNTAPTIESRESKEGPPNMPNALIENSEATRASPQVTPERLGFVIGEGYDPPPNCVLGEDGRGVNLYAMISVCWKAIQELSAKISTEGGAPDGRTHSSETH